MAKTKKKRGKHYRDFGKAKIESSKERIEFSFAGKDYSIPMAMTAKSQLEALRLQEKEEAWKLDEENAPPVTASDVHTSMSAILGGENFDSLLDDSISDDELIELVTWIKDIILGDVEEPEEDTGKNE